MSVFHKHLVDLQLIAPSAGDDAGIWSSEYERIYVLTARAHSGTGSAARPSGRKSQIPLFLGAARGAGA